MLNSRVLLITYYWPPAGGGGTQRWLKMSKYFKDFGVDLTIYTPSNPEYPIKDEDSLKQVSQSLKVIKHPIWEPYSIYKRFTSKKQEENIYSGFINEKSSWKNKISIWIRGNLFIPDARKYWIKPSLKKLTKFFERNKYNIIITTGPPHSMHLIGLGLKKKFPSMKWIADFRDPWTNIDFYDQLMLSTFADKKHKSYEKMVLQSADKVVAVSPSMIKELNSLGNIKADLIPNGYDHLDFNKRPQPDNLISIRHIGSLNKDRNPLVLWSALKNIKESNKTLYKKIKIELIGNVDHSIKQSIEERDLIDSVKIKGFIPHNEATETMMKSRILLLIINNTPNSKGILTGKLFEYLGARRPILCIGPCEGDSKELLKEFTHVKYVSYNDLNGCIHAVEELSELEDLDSIPDTSKYTRQNLAKSYCNLIKQSLCKN